jgi:hypothetical protein
MHLNLQINTDQVGSLNLQAMESLRNDYWPIQLSFCYGKLPAREQNQIDDHAPGAPLP